MPTDVIGNIGFNNVVFRYPSRADVPVCMNKYYGLQHAIQNQKDQIL